MTYGIFVGALIMGGIIWLILVQKTVKPIEEEIDVKETCLMETIEAPQIEPQGYYNEYGAWVELN